MKVVSRLTSLMVAASYIVAFAAFIFAAVMTATNQLWVTQLGDLSTVGLASICALYVLSESRFRALGTPPVRSVVLAVLFANAFLNSYEIVYGLSFLPALTGTELRTIILWVVMVSPLVLMRDYLRVDKKISLPLISIFAALWCVWIAYGFPQYYFSGYPYSPIFRTDDPFHLSLWLNYSSKAVFAAFFASFLAPANAFRSLWSRVRQQSRAPAAHPL